MAVAYDTFSNVADGTGDLSWTHTPVGTPRGVVVYIVYNSSSNEVSSVTYGGVAMNEVLGSPVRKSTGEVGTVHCFFLGSGIPTGAQTIYVTVSRSTNKRAGCYTVTANKPTKLQDIESISDDNLRNPSATLSLGSVSSFCSIGFFSGQDASTSITPLTGWTGSLEDSVIAYSRGWYKYDTIGTTDVTTGWTQNNDDAVAISTAITEDNNLFELSVYDLSISRDSDASVDPPEFYFTLVLESNILFDDKVFITEYVNSFILEYIIDTSSTIYASEFIDLLTPEYILNTADIIYASEKADLLIPEYILNIADIIYASEKADLLIPEYILNIVDIIYASESIIFLNDYILNIVDIIYASEKADLLIPEYLIDIFDFSYSNEFIEINLTSFITSIELSSITEILIILITDYLIDVVDNSSVSEYVTFSKDFFIVLDDTVYITEVVNSLISDYFINVNDLIQIEREYAEILIPDYYFNIFELIHVEEIIFTSQGEYLIQIIELVNKVEDTVDILIPFYHVDLADISQLVEYILLLNIDARINILNENISIIETITISMGVPSGYQNLVYSLTNFDYVETIAISNINEIIGI